MAETPSSAPRGPAAEVLRKVLSFPSETDLALACAAPEVLGLPELRERWRLWQRRGIATDLPSSLPVATAGLSHALSLLADLFAGEGTPVAVSSPFWGNYRQAFATRAGAAILTAEAYVDGRYNPAFVPQALCELPAGVPALALVNFPSNPGGYSPTSEERQATLEALRAEAERRPLLVVCDDAYAGLVFEPDVPARSLFWDLIGLHPNLTPVKVDGATKEFSFFGGRVGFLTFGLQPGSAPARELEARLAALIGSSVGSATAVGQVLLLQALRNEAIEAEVEEVRLLLAGRYRALRDALSLVDPAVLEVLPFNSGCFALVEIPAALGFDSEVARRHLLERWETGLISLSPRYLRIAHCSVDAASLPELASRLERGIAELTQAYSRPLT
jgi:aspartate/methionine/tyrosine aminotransferase